MQHVDDLFFRFKKNKSNVKSIHDKVHARKDCKGEEIGKQLLIFSGMWI